MRYADVKKAYNKVKTPQQAKLASILKWRYWSECSLKQLKKTAGFDDAGLAGYCGLCKLFINNDDVKCPLCRSKICGGWDSNEGCCVLYARAVEARGKVLHSDASISVFHTAAKKLLARIEQI